MLIDWTRLGDLHQEIGPDDFGEVVELFLEEVLGTIEKLRQNSDPDALEADLHFLKGGALNLGFSQFASLCQQGEHLAANGHREEVQLPDILLCFDTSLVEFRRELPDRFAA